MKYAYAGSGPQEVDGFGLIRPGDEYEFDSAPDWGPWNVVIEEKPAVPPPSTQPPPAPDATASIQAALDKTPPGGSVELAAGTTTITPATGTEGK